MSAGDAWCDDLAPPDRSSREQCKPISMETLNFTVRAGPRR